MGIIVSFCAFIYLLITVFKAIVWDNPVDGYPSLMSVILFLGGIQLLALGVIGEYIGIIYTETKKGRCITSMSIQNREVRTKNQDRIERLITNRSASPPSGDLGGL